MAIQVALFHRTVYRYDRRVALGPQVVRLRPAAHCRTPILSYSLTVAPHEHFLNWQQDPFGNFLGRLVFPEKTDRFALTVELVAEMVVINPFDFFLEPEGERFPFTYDRQLRQDLAPYLGHGPAGDALAAYLADVDRRPRQTIEFLVALNRQVSRDIRYLIRMEANVQSCERTLQLRSGSCRDSAWLLVNLLRHLGLAARFVSGYLIQLAADVPALDGPAGPSSDFTDLHAWVEVYLPGAGWVGLDPTSGLLAGEGHIPLACSPEPRSAAPVTGALEECEVDFSHEMRVDRVRQDPRPTRPYAEEVWARIVAAGDVVENALQEGDVRLTMGGEPTFVGIDNPDAAEWNSDALGEEKHRLSAQLLAGLRRQWAPGGLLHCGQGKWYPGEPLPRWALACYWREDGVPLWNDDRWLADPSGEYGFGVVEARRFIEELAGVLGVTKEFIRESYEDIVHYLHREQRLPANVSPDDPRLDDAEGRRGLVDALERGLGAVVGYVLPLRHGSWISGPWPFRGDHLLLLPGDSPAGLRLPLDSLPWEPPGRRQVEIPLDPMAERGPLPDLRLWQDAPSAMAQSQPGGVQPQAPPEAEDEKAVVRTALCVQPRQGRLYVFMPPIASLEGYIELIHAVEVCAGRTGLPVVIEGYAPPTDPRLQCLKITPDPGVIEVNIQPMRSWREMIDRTTTLYELARQSRLATEKFLLDGRRTGTGGGSHIVVGGPTAADSPLLRRPDVLRSLLAFWNNHPALSYLFSGMFIGPTSQQPRVDEARHDSLYELEIAFAELDRQTRDQAACPPWLVDRLFRHLLVDVSGNTHRAELCIDKLYSPDSSAGRLGLLEFRAFEMPPHARMSLAQQLLLRACLAWFWRVPYRRPLVRWGTSLHDRFMLPEAVGDDIADVVAILAEAGFPLEREFFRPHLEFRFPLHGRFRCAGLEVELRQALEPWHVLGEEPGGGGTVRYVDSSVERLQVRIEGQPGDRYLLLCNGRRIPLQPTRCGAGRFGAVRYRAWQPPSCLHPTIGVHTPLTFDLVDTWNSRSLGGCVYHVGHPGGRNYQTLPVNDHEAAGRRLARFSCLGHSPGVLVAVPPREDNAHFPLTLDLRRQTTPPGV